MEGFQIFCTIFATVVGYALADHEYMVTKAEPVAMSIDFETTLQCVMNIAPDKFQWKFYPLPAKDVFNPKAFISLSSSDYELVSAHKYAGQNRESFLSIQATSEKIAGDYQCLAHYGASVVASVPWRITIATMGKFPDQENIDIIVTAGNTINWRCEPPLANPDLYIEYYKGDEWVKPSTVVPTKSLTIVNATMQDSGTYRCKSFNSTGNHLDSKTFLKLKVVRSGASQAPRFIMPPKKSYTVAKGGSVLLECAAVGTPPPEVIWRKISGFLPEKRSEMVRGGLVIRNVTSSDDGVYECHHKNHRGSISQEITLVYNESPKIDCLLNSTDVTQGENLDLDCTVTGTPEPQISWFLNGFSVANDTAIEAVGNKIYFRPTEKRHAGNLQIFARNVVETVYSSISIRVIPLSTTQDNTSDPPVPPTRGHSRKHPRKPPKHIKMYPPSKPTVSRLNDEAVVVRWNIQPNKGLDILFFKVQYRELGPANQHEHHNRRGSKWMTTNADIPPHIRSYEVNNLKPDYVYRFRIAAVYSNNDNKNSPNSDKFHLRKMDFEQRNPLPVPLITNTETINSTAVKIYWKCDVPPNLVIDGYFINYNSASSAADYMRAPVDGQNTTSFILNHLQNDTVYDIKLQSFTSKFASEFSSIMKAKTQATVATGPVTKNVVASSSPETAGISKLYIIIAAAVLGGGVLIGGLIALLVFCRKWKRKKNGTSGVDEHHIQADGNEYVVGSKNVPRSNGCLPPNRITITANPLADTDNKNQNMIEMSCLSSQNNNCSAVQPSGSGEDSPTNSRDKKNKHREKRIRSKHNVESNTSGENYV